MQRWPSRRGAAALLLAGVAVVAAVEAIHWALSLHRDDPDEVLRQRLRLYAWSDADAGAAAVPLLAVVVAAMGPAAQAHLPDLLADLRALLAALPLDGARALADSVRVRDGVALAPQYVRALRQRPRVVVVSDDEATCAAVAAAPEHTGWVEAHCLAPGASVLRAFNDGVLRAPADRVLLLLPEVRLLRRYHARAAGDAAALWALANVDAALVAPAVLAAPAPPPDRALDVTTELPLQLATGGLDVFAVRDPASAAAGAAGPPRNLVLPFHHHQGRQLPPRPSTVAEPIAAPWPGAMLVRRHAFATAGGFDAARHDSLAVAALDLALRMRTLAAREGAAPVAVVCCTHARRGKGAVEGGADGARHASRRPQSHSLRPCLRSRSRPMRPAWRPVRSVQRSPPASVHWPNAHQRPSCRRRRRRRRRNGDCAGQIDGVGARPRRRARPAAVHDAHASHQRRYEAVGRLAVLKWRGSHTHASLRVSGEATVSVGRLPERLHRLGERSDQLRVQSGTGAWRAAVRQPPFTRRAHYRRDGAAHLARLA